MTKPQLKKKSVPRTVPRVPEVLKIIGEESRRNGTDQLTSRQIDATIKAYRKAKKKEHE
jgi:hypothetical protein